jgi:peptidoglycan hydrolase-like protein with peptidoglycan-binding domain
MLSVSLDRQMIDVFRGTALVMSSKVSSGMPGHETKPGVFSILEKQRFHHSNIYSGAPMPWMQRLTRSGTALHAGMVPGYPASHGCVRLPFAFAPKLFQMTAVGETVLIASERLAPKPIEHPKLFQPRPRPVALAMAATAQIPWRLTDGAEENPAGTAILPLVIARDAGVTPETAESASSDNGDALAPTPLRILVTRRTPRDQLISVQYALCSMGLLTRQNFDGTFGKATAAAIRAFQTANGLTETGALNGDLVKKIYEVAGKPVPPEGHLFVRQGFARVFDDAIAFRQPSQPLGTHVYTALNFAADDTKVRWVSFSLDGGDAASALDRLEIPEDVRRTISEMLTPGSSLIVADTSVDSAILPEGDDFLVWAKEPEANEPSTKAPALMVQSPNIKQANIEPVKPKRTARARATASPRESWPRPTRRYTANRPPRFEPPRWFSPW